MKLVVPSSGSMIQLNSLSGPVSPDSSARIPCPGKASRDFDDRLLGRVIHLGHEVVRRLRLHREQVELGGGAIDHGGCAARGLDGDVQGGMHAVRSRLKKRGAVPAPASWASKVGDGVRQNTES